MNASCWSWRLVMRLGVLFCFSERVLKWERAVRMRLVGLGILLCGNASCRFFLTRLEMGACHVKASCRSCLCVKYEHVLPKQHQRYCK